MRNDHRDTDRIIIRKMIGYCDTIASLLERFDNSFDLYLTDMAFQLSCNMCILQIGELTSRLTEEFRTEHDGIPWHLIKAMRNIHAHDYERVDF